MPNTAAARPRATQARTRGRAERNARIGNARSNEKPMHWRMSMRTIQRGSRKIGNHIQFTRVATKSTSPRRRSVLRTRAARIPAAAPRTWTRASEQPALKREAGAEEEGRRDEAVDPLQPRPERARGQRGLEQHQRVGLDHHQDGDAAEPVEGADARHPRLSRNSSISPRVLNRTGTPLVPTPPLVIPTIPPCRHWPLYRFRPVRRCLRIACPPGKQTWPAWVWPQR